MLITCLGAAGCVTGSCFLIENGEKYLVDCGLFQGGKKIETLNRHGWGFDPKEISALFLTHAHIDHSGRIPKLVKDGFKGKIYTTLPTAELCKILLLDSAHIHEMEAEWQTRKNRRRGEPEVKPLYSEEDARACLPLFEVIESDETISIDSNLRVCFRNAGHILGASILEVWNGPPPQSCKTVFSGDLGQKGQLIVQDPHAIHKADTLFIESTYGNRNHRSFEESKRELIEAIHTSHSHNEKVIIPAYAVERTQEILYLLGEFFRNKLIPSMPVYLDSPLAIAATDIFRRMRAFYDRETVDILNAGHDPFNFPQLILSRTTEDSMAINRTRGPAIVIAGNGMCTAGRIKHHLKHNLWRKGSCLVIMGYQAEESLGRRIIEGARSVKILGETIMVRAKVYTIGGLSAHADQSDLLDWVSHFGASPPMRVVVIHGEREISEIFAKLVHERFGFPVVVPGIGDLISVEPFRHEARIEPVPGVKLPAELSSLLQKLKETEKLWEESPQAFPAHLVQELEDELSGAAERLERVLEAVKKTGRPVK